MTDENLLKPLWKVYELNCLIGIVKARMKQWSLKIKNKKDDQELFDKIQNDLFAIQKEIARINEETEIEPQSAFLEEAEVFFMEKIKDYEMFLPKLEHFILPEGSELGASLFHLSTFTRSVILEMDYLAPTSKYIVEYLERLAYFFFLLARYVNFTSGHKEREPDYGEKEIKVKVINEDVKITYNNIMLEMDPAIIAYFRNKAIKVEERKQELN